MASVAVLFLLLVDDLHFWIVVHEECDHDSWHVLVEHESKVIGSIQSGRRSRSEHKVIAVQVEHTAADVLEQLFVLLREHTSDLMLAASESDSVGMKLQRFCTAACSACIAMEFRRCSGDGLAFAHIFEQASAHLRLSFSLAPAQAPLLPTPPPVPAGDASAFLQPLVEMVSCGHAPAEAEAAAALAAVVSASTAGILAASLDVQKTLEELCESRAVETAYPAARLASGLVTSSCEHHLASELTFAALRGAAADHLDGLVRLELAEAVRAVAQKCAFCEAVSVNRDDLQRALEEAFARGVLSEETSTASLRLREALGTLEATQHVQDGVMA
eukprot:s1595_g9.t1